jgi:predicted dehydrogenase
MPDKVRIGVLGAGRGAYVAHLFDLHPRAVTVALCESDPGRLDLGRQRLPNLEATYADYDAFLAHDTDVVIVANDATAHAPYAIKALEAGKHVLSEVMACKTLAEAVALVRAVERAKTIYSFGENCCTMRQVLEMKRLYRAGDLGEYLYGECEYVHDCTGAWPRLTYGDPAHWRNWIPATTYCSHSLGPILDITGTRPVRCVGFTTPNRLGRMIGRRGDDLGAVLCQMDNDAVTKVLLGLALRREPVLHWYSLYGTRGQVENDRGLNEELLHVYLEQDRGAVFGRSYVPAFPHELEWARGASGHGGADEYMVDAFMRAILEGGPAPIDVYRGLEMTLPGILGFRSAYEGSIPLEVPDLRQESVRLRYEDDHWSPDPQDAGAGQPASSSAHGKVEVPPGVYAEQRRRYQQGR